MFDINVPQILLKTVYVFMKYWKKQPGFVILYNIAFSFIDACVETVYVLSCINVSLFIYYVPKIKNKKCPFCDACVFSFY